MVDLLIKGGTVVTPEVTGPMDIFIQGEKIVGIAEPDSFVVNPTQTIDATGRVVVPGGIEPHSHLGGRVNPRWSPYEDAPLQSPEDGSRAAAFGGTTTIIDFAPAMQSNSIQGGIKARRELFEGNSYVDFAFHSTLGGDVSPEVIGEIGDAIRAGIASFKVFTRTSDGYLWAIMEQVARHGGIMAIHAENYEIVAYMEEKLKREGRDQAYNIHLAHNNVSEDVAFRTVIRLAHSTGAGVYFVHVTAKEGVAAIAEARSQGQPIYGEALHNYLEFTSEDYKRPGGTAVHTYPALKYSEDRDALNRGLLEGHISTVATDDYTAVKREVKIWGKTVDSLCGGHNGIETRLPVVYSKFVAKGLISLERFVAVTSTNAAKILGLYPKKGALAVGSDADVVIIDPSEHRTITQADLHGAADYTIWEGFQCEGYPITTISRGKVIVDQGELLGDSSHGQWLARRIDPSILARPQC